MTAKELKDKYDHDLEELQNTCRHIDTKLMDYSWAPGHIAPFKVNVCKQCWKIIPTKESPNELKEHETILSILFGELFI